MKLCVSQNINGGLSWQRTQPASVPTGMAYIPRADGLYVRFTAIVTVTSVVLSLLRG